MKTANKRKQCRLWCVFIINEFIKCYVSVKKGINNTIVGQSFHAVLDYTSLLESRLKQPLHWELIHKWVFGYPHDIYLDYVWWGQDDDDDNDDGLGRYDSVWIKNCRRSYVESINDKKSHRQKQDEVRNKDLKTWNTRHETGVMTKRTEVIDYTFSWKRNKLLVAATAMMFSVGCHAEWRIFRL